MLKANMILNILNLSNSHHGLLRGGLAIVCLAGLIFVSLAVTVAETQAQTETVSGAQTTESQPGFQNQNFTTTLELARDGNPEAMYAVAIRLLDENAESYQMDAFGWALNAARAGHPKAAELTGRLYRIGLGVDVNYVKSRKWLLRALKRGAIGAHFELALLYADEDNPSFDTDEAAEHMANALKKSEPRACLVAAQGKINSELGIRKALKELTCAANGGIVMAMIYIADYYISKRSPNATYQAKQWLQKAVDAGSQEALQKLAELP